MAKFDRKSAYKRTSLVENSSSVEESATSENWVPPSEARYSIHIKVNGIMPRNGACSLDPRNLHTSEEIQAVRDAGDERKAEYMERQNAMQESWMKAARHSKTGVVQVAEGIYVISKERQEEYRRERYGWNDFNIAEAEKHYKEV